MQTAVTSENGKKTLPLCCALLSLKSQVCLSRNPNKCLFFNPKKAAIIILKMKCILQLENIFKKWQNYLMWYERASAVDSILMRMCV